MATKYSLALAFLVLSTIRDVHAQPAPLPSPQSSPQPSPQSGIFDVVKYGAKADSNEDIGQALLSAWKDGCGSTTPSQVLIPQGTYFMNQVKLEGPCKAPIELQVQGIVRSPADPNQMKDKSEWLTIQYVDQFTLSGSGTFDGQGKTAWGQNDCHKNAQCKKLPYNLSFNFLNRTMVRDITSLDSKNFHVMVFGCQDITFLNVSITAPGDSINTDGIHIGRSSGINITSSTIKTGDDCISVGDGTRNLTISKVTCGPGHGISIGSLGKYQNEEEVNGVFVTNCTFFNTTNGVRVKTWPASYAGLVTDVHFEDIIMQDVANPVLVDQEYCPYNNCQQQVPSKVKLTKMGFKNIRGTSSTPVAVKFVCSKNVPCENVEVGDIDLAYNGKEGPVTSNCANVQPTLVGKQNPPVCVNPAQSS